LTRLYNRRGLSRRVERILEAGTGDTYAVVMIDLDDLKEVNDTYGHESGDQYIISAAEILKKIVGESGLTAHVTAAMNLSCSSKKKAKKRCGRSSRSLSRRRTAPKPCCTMDSMYRCGSPWAAAS